MKQIQAPRRETHLETYPVNVETRRLLIAETTL